MNVETTSLDPRIAAIHYKDYRKRVRAHRAERIKTAEALITEGNKMRRRAYAEKSLVEKEDETLMAAYREMAKGQRILNLAAVMTKAGIDTNTKSRLPVLAVARADWKHVRLKVESGRVVFSENTTWSSWDYKRGVYRDGSVHFQREVFPAEFWNIDWRKGQNLPAPDQQRALVPAIPAHLRPIGDLSGFHILWEAKWERSAPDDPLLLKHVSGHIYTVLAQWDLSPVEQMVLEGRLA